MATEIVELKWDDLDLYEDGPANKIAAVETVTFVYDDVVYAIDLSEKHFREYEEYMTRLLNAARPAEKPRQHPQVRKPSGAASPKFQYRRGLREYFKDKGDPVPSWERDGKTAGYRYTEAHYSMYNDHLRTVGRGNERREFEK